MDSSRSGVATQATGESSIAELDVGGEPLLLLPGKAAFLPRSDTLLVADVHIGKAVSFRKLGVPVPSGTTTETLSVLTTLVRRMSARRIVFLGDLLHSARSHAPATLDAFARWRAEHPTLDLVLVRGNHDDRAGDPPPSLGIETVDEPFAHGSIFLAHHPRPHADGYVLAGHLHPCISLGGRAHDWLRLPCFWLGARVGVLPAFGEFTGMAPIRVRRGERVFGATDERVFELRPVKR